MKTISAGIYPDVPMDDYINDPAPEPSLSSGVAHTLIAKSPAHARAEHPRLTPQADDSTSRSDLGSLVHQLVLGGDRMIVVVDHKDWRTDDAKAQREAARKEGKIAILSKQEDEIRTIADRALNAIMDAGYDLPEARREHTLVWQDNGVWCRCRPDAILDRPVIDLKTTENAEPLNWVKRTMLPGGYHIQAAHNLRGLEVLGEPERKFIFALIEISPPYAMSFVGVSPAMLAYAQSQQQAAVKRWGECLRSGKWPGYCADVHWVDPPTYATLEWEMQMYNDMNAENMR